MRHYNHLSLRYVINRFSAMIYERTHPDHPWLPKPANAILSSCLKESDIGLEFGSGRSTAWLAKQVSFITSVEHDEGWYEKVRQMLLHDKINNVEYLLVEINAAMPKDGASSGYVHVLDRFSDGSLAFVLVDGKYRSACALGAVQKLSPGGLLVIDDAQRYLPSESRAPYARSVEQGPVSEQWAEFLVAVSGWRNVWAGDGVGETAVYFKPCVSHMTHK